MAECIQIRPLLYPYLEREVEPAEAIEVANHLSNCTACKILIARKQRLGQMLEEELDDRIPVGEDFVLSVMKNLPDGPPPRENRRKARRRFDLAVLFGVAVAVTQIVARRLPGTASPLSAPNLPTLSLPTADGAAPVFETALHLVATAAHAIVGGRVIELSSLPILGSLFVLGLVAIGSFVVLGGSALFALAAGSIARSRSA